MSARLSLSPRQAHEFLLVQIVLQKIIIEMLDSWPASTLRVTSISRTLAENDDAGAKTPIHVVGPPYRAIDIRIRSLDEMWREGAAAAKRVNRRWIYDPNRRRFKVAYA